MREIIWDAATSLFAEKGYDETTVDEIAQAAGVSPRSCYRYFANKSEIMAYSLVSFAEQIIEALDACPETWTMREVFRRMMLQVVDDAVKHPRPRRVFEILKRWPSPPPRSQPEWQMPRRWSAEPLRSEFLKTVLLASRQPCSGD